MSTWKVFSDGGSRGNPGPAAYGFIVYADEKEIHSDKKYIGDSTNNIAEYSGLLAAAKWASENITDDVKEIIFTLDSELVVKQMKGEYKIKNKNLFEIAQKVKAMERKFSQTVSYLHVKRAENKEADLLVNQAIDAHAL